MDRDKLGVGHVLVQDGDAREVDGDMVGPVRVRLALPVGQVRESLRDSVLLALSDLEEERDVLRVGQEAVADTVGCVALAERVFVLLPLLCEADDDNDFVDDCDVLSVPALLDVLLVCADEDMEEVYGKVAVPENEFVDDWLTDCRDSVCDADVDSEPDVLHVGPELEIELVGRVVLADCVLVTL